MKPIAPISAVQQPILRHPLTFSLVHVSFHIVWSITGVPTVLTRFLCCGCQVRQFGVFGCPWCVMRQDVPVNFLLVSIHLVTAVAWT